MFYSLKIRCDKYKGKVVTQNYLIFFCFTKYFSHVKYFTESFTLINIIDHCIEPSYFCTVSIY